MSDTTDLVHSTSTTARDVFPHPCPHYPGHGAGIEQCRIATQLFEGNKKCCESKCNSMFRKCFMCLALGRTGSKVRSVVDPATGMCWEHAEGRTETPVPAKPMPPRHHRPHVHIPPRRIERPAPFRPPAPPAQPPAPPVRVESKPPVVPQAPKPSPVVLPAITAEEKIIIQGALSAKQLNPRRRKMLRLCGLGMDNGRIAVQIPTSKATVGVEFASVYATLGLHDLPKADKRPTAIAIAKVVFADDPEYQAAKASA